MEKRQISISLDDWIAEEIAKLEAFRDFEAPRIDKDKTRPARRPRGEWRILCEFLAGMDD